MLWYCDELAFVFGTAIAYLQLKWDAGNPAMFSWILFICDAYYIEGQFHVWQCYTKLKNSEKIVKHFKILKEI